MPLPLLWSSALDALEDRGVALDAASVSVVRQADRGGVVVVQPTLDGTPVDLSHRVRVDARGGVRHVSVQPLPPAVSAGPPLPAGRALELVRGRFGAAAHARLSWIPSGPRLRRVWTVDLGGPVPGLPQARPLVRLDAATGLLLGIDDGAVHQEAPLARAYLTNPVLQPDPVEVALPLAGAALSDARVELSQCRDLGEVQTWIIDDRVWDFHVCTGVPAAGPVGGHYLYPPVPYPDDPARDEDDFAAPHTYHNVHLGLQWFDALGWAPIEGFDPRLVVTVNRRITDLWSEETASDPSKPLAPYDNAYSSGGYLDWQDEWVPPALVFGQGEAFDYSYDADVIHHELGHFIVKSQGGPSFSLDTDYGPSVEANALNEAFADYFSAAIQGEPELGEYVAGDRGVVRDLSGDATCAEDLYGEPHYDGQPFSQALWGFRRSLPQADRATFDAVVLDSLATMGMIPTFAQAAGVLIDLADERLGAGDALAAAFDARGVRDCPPILPVVPADEPFRRFTYVPASYEWGTIGPKPGYLQFAVEIPEGGARVDLTFEQPEYLGLDPYGDEEPRELVVVGQRGERIAWTVDTEEAEVELDGEVYTFLVDAWRSDARPVAVTARVGGEPSEDGRDWLHRYAARWEVKNGGRYVFQLTNPHPREAVALDLAVALSPLPEAPEPPLPDEEPRPAEGGEAPVACGCETGPAAGWLWLAGLLALARRRRGR